MRYKNVIFDLDGTLTDSGEGITGCGRYAFEQLGLSVPDMQELRTMVGPPLAESFARLGVPGSRIEEAVRLFRDKYNNHGGKYQNRVYPGIEDLLGELIRSGCRLYVATSKPETTSRDILEKFRLSSRFEYIAGASPGHSRESKADVLEYLLKITGSSDDCVMVGDTRFDVTGAREKGLPCIGVTWGYGTKEELQTAGAAETVDSPEELLKYLRL